MGGYIRSYFAGGFACMQKLESSYFEGDRLRLKKEQVLLHLCYGILWSSSEFE